MAIRSIVSIAAFSVFASPAAAQEAPYVAASGALVFPEDFSSSIGIEADTDSGYAVTGAVGHHFGSFRAELEGSFRESEVGEARAIGFTVEGAGEVSALSAMANVYFDPALPLGPLRPYIGAGAGISRFEAQDVEAIGLPEGLPELEPVSAGETGFSYQFMAGAGLSLTERAILTAGYRYFATPSIETDVAPFGPVTIDGLGLHELQVGVRLAF